MKLNEYDITAWVIRWMIKNKAGNELDITDNYLIEKIIDTCHSDLRKYCISNETKHVTKYPSSSGFCCK